jgi:ABC-type phosphate transport system substrate-binding protein
MRMLTRLAVGVAAATATVTMAMMPAMADPNPGTVPAPHNIVGVGSDTIQNVMDQFSHDYNASHTANKLYSWDATNPTTGAIGDTIVTKATSTDSTTCSMPRPDGSSAGITALTTANPTISGHPCIDFARSSRDRQPTDPPYAKGGIAFVDLAGDAVTWAANSTTNAPANLTTAQLTAIYECTDTNWDQVGGKNAPIHAFIPQPGSGTRAFFLTALGNGTPITPGSCVSDDNGLLEENEGVNSVLAGPDTIFPYSIGKWIAEADHSATCFNKACTANSAGKACAPKSGQNLYGCNTHGTMVLKEINGTKPTTGSGTSQKINSTFSPAFVRTLFEVVKYSTATGNVNHIPPYLVPFFGPSGWVCTSGTAKKDLLDYGFIVHSTCGLTH